QHDRDHEVRAPPVHGADEPAQRDLVVQRLQAVPRLGRGRHVDEREQDTGQELQYEDDECSATEHVPPARGAAGHRMPGRVPDRRGELEPGVEPCADLRELQAHGGLPVESNAMPPGVGSSPAWITSAPPTTFDGYSKSPRSGGPEARAPSR